MINTIVKVFRGIAKLRGATDNTLIGNVDDKLKVTGGEEGDELEIKPALSHQVDFNLMNCHLEEIIKQLRILNTHMTCVTDLEDLEEEPGDHPL